MFIHPKKSLGQHLLRSHRVIDSMVEAGLVDSHDIVVEAGPGKGILTEALLSCARQVIAIEKDPRFSLYLSYKFKQEIADEKLVLITGDILEFNPETEGLQAGGYKVIANIPYYLTGAFLRHFLSGPTPPSRMVLLLQREVARRIVASDNKESILSLSVKVYGKPKYLETVPAELFTPKPKVDSAVLLIEDISKHAFKHLSEEHYFEILKTGFSQKRKKLLGNLSVLAPREKLQELFARFSIHENARAENVSLSRWKQLAQALHP